MNTNENSPSNNRRHFLSTLATGAAAVSLTTFAPSLQAMAGEVNSIPGTDEDPDAWFKKIKGKHRVVFDATQPHEIMPFAWPKVFLLTNEMTGTPNTDCGVVVVLRHTAMGYAMEDRLWAKYKFGELFKANDPETNKPSLRNPFWKPKPGAFKIPGAGEVEIGIDQLQSKGVMFCVCEMAIMVYSAVAAQMNGMDAAEVKKDFVSGILPGIQKVPSGVWALGRAQEHKCAYVFAG